MKARPTITLAGAALVLLGSASAAAQSADGAQRPPAEVTFVQVTPQSPSVSYERLGVVEASRIAEVRSRVRGYLAKRLFHEGDLVTEGQVLFQVEKDMFEVAVQAREADLQDAMARLDLAKREFERKKALRETGAASQEDLDRAEVERDRAQAVVAGAEADLREARLELSYTEIVAPTSGIISPAIRDVGDLVDESSNSHLATITRVSPIYVTYGISEADYLAMADAGNLRLDDGVTFKLILQNGREFGEAGKLNYKSSEFEASTGMLRVRIEFPNAEGLLRPNQFVKLIEDHGARDGVISVPARSVLQSPAGPAVFVIDDADTLQFRPVKVGDWREGSWEIESGLAAGERVMVDGLLKSAPGTPVRPIAYVSANNTATTTTVD
ncbi:MAG: rane fusion protein multidrug efflux system [Candidatus Sumerlaeota bacterium]|nr:rane fusion protein multidrug efflux system [Candidatus Sumerlaeota bacterium]